MRTLLLDALERLLVLLLAAVFALPLAVAGGLRYSRLGESTRTAWLRNVTLNGRQVPPSLVPCSAATVFSARYQGALAKDFNFHFAGREAFIRLVNEIDLRAFGAGPPGLLVGGRPPSIVEQGYAEEYCLLRGDRERLRPLVEGVRRMQAACAARGIAFALVVTPSKAAVLPESLPAAWQRRYRPAPRGYDQAVEMLREAGIHLVDGHRIAVGLKAGAPAPVFPAGGVHWGDQPALATTDALLELLASQGLAVSPLRYTAALTTDAAGQDVDMMGLVNIMYPWRYPVWQATILPADPPRAHRPNLLWVGGSFTWKMLWMTAASKQFEQMDYYGYYKLDKHSATDTRQWEVAAPTPPVNFATDVFAADALVLETNEQNIAFASHLLEFTRDALAALPDPHAPRAPFHHEVPPP